MLVQTDCLYLLPGLSVYLSCAQPTVKPSTTAALHGGCAELTFRLGCVLLGVLTHTLITLPAGTLVWGRALLLAGQCSCVRVCVRLSLSPPCCLCFCLGLCFYLSVSRSICLSPSLSITLSLFLSLSLIQVQLQIQLYCHRAEYKYRDNEMWLEI